jgi:hypothetical protein
MKNLICLLSAFILIFLVYLLLKDRVQVKSSWCGVEMISDDQLEFRHPFTGLVAGSTGSGKTHLVRKILENYKLMTSIKTETLSVLWCYGQYQDLYKKPISPNVSVEYYEGLPPDTLLNQIKPDIIVCDDLMSEISKSDNVADIFTKKSHHMNISIFFIVQNLFFQGKSMRTISLNSQYIVLLKSVRDKQQINALGRQLYPKKSTFFIDVYNDATSQPFGYLLIDLHPLTHDNLRLRTRITPIKDKLKPIIYEMK